MRNLLLLIATVALVFSCEKLKDLAQVDFNFDDDSAEITIPTTTSTATFTQTETFSMNLDSLIKAQNAELAVNYLKTLTINSITLTLQDGDVNNNFGNVESCTISFSSNLNTTPVEIGALSSNPADESYTLSIPVNESIDIKDYAKNATTFNYTLSGKLRKATTKDVKCKVKVNYKVTAGL